MMNQLDFKPIKKDRLFYDQYHYCINFYLQEASCLRDIDHEHVDVILERRRLWREAGRERINRFAQYKPIDQQVVANLHNLVDIFLQSQVQFKTVTTVDQLWIYSNDLNFISRLYEIPFLEHKTLTKALIAHARDTISIKNPQHQYRTYFKNQAFSQDEKTKITNFLLNQTECRLGPGLGDWLANNWLRTQDHYFIDHNEHSLLTMLCLIKPGLLRKTKAIAAS